MSRTLRERCLAIDLLVTDVDGVLTEGDIIHGTGGLEIKHFHVRDGSGLKIWREAGKRVAVITGRTSPVVDTRAAELGIDLVFQGVGAKIEAYRKVLAAAGAAPDRVCYVGDDLPDLPPLRHCGLAVAVADACVEVKVDSHHVTRARGGRGAVREIIELILRCQDRWRPAVDRLRGESL